MLSHQSETVVRLSSWLDKQEKKPKPYSSSHILTNSILHEVVESTSLDCEILVVSKDPKADTPRPKESSCATHPDGLSQSRSSLVRHLDFKECRLSFVFQKSNPNGRCCYVFFSSLGIEKIEVLSLLPVVTRGGGVVNRRR